MDKSWKGMVFGLAVAMALGVCGATADAALITFGVNNGDVALGEIDLGEANGNASYTWVNPAGAGFDIRLSNDKGANGWDGEVPPGAIKTKGNASPVVTFEFFETGTSNPVDVTGFRVMFGDLDDSGSGIPAENFLVTSGGVESPLDVSTFEFGSDLEAWDKDGDGITDDIKSNASFGDQFGEPSINAVVNTGALAVSKLTFKSNDYVHIGNATEANMAIIPEPATLILALAGGLIMLRRREE